MMAYPELRHPYASRSIHESGQRTVLYPGRRFVVEKPGPGSGLLVSPADLERLTGFVLKPEGACLGDLCVPLPASLLSQQGNQTWIDLEAFAELLGQAYVSDPEAAVWSFAELPDKRARTLTEATAPDLTITDRAGNVFNLADLKGRKALIVTWSSW